MWLLKNHHKNYLELNTKHKIIFDLLSLKISFWFIWSVHYKDKKLNKHQQIEELYEEEQIQCQTWMGTVCTIICSDKEVDSCWLPSDAWVIIKEPLELGICCRTSYACTEESTPTIGFSSTVSRSSPTNKNVTCYFMGRIPFFVTSDLLVSLSHDRKFLSPYFRMFIQWTLSVFQEINSRDKFWTATCLLVPVFNVYSKLCL